jgi:non-lysosomal glucosylceramidase
MSDKDGAEDSRPDASCCGDSGCDTAVNRRDFVRVLGMGLTALPAGAAAAQSPDPAASPVSVPSNDPQLRAALDDREWPSLVAYDEAHLARIALPLGGIGTGTVSLGGRGDLRDWEIMNRPAKGFVPASGGVAPFLALYARQENRTVCRLLEGPLEAHAFEGSHGSPVVTSNLPRFRNASFAAAYPFGRVMLRDPDVPLDVDIKAFNPLIPADADASGIPLAVLVVELRNNTAAPVHASVAMTLPNFIGIDGSETTMRWTGDLVPSGANGNRNEAREQDGLRGIVLSSEGVDRKHPAWGTIAFATPLGRAITWRTAWQRPRWGVPLLDFWDDFSADGRLEEREAAKDVDMPVASVAAAVEVPQSATVSVPFLLAWHFPNRLTWTPEKPPVPDDVIGNYYAARYTDAWDVLGKETPRLPELRRRSMAFVRTVIDSALPAAVKEAALFNVSTLRTQTCFRTPDGRFFGFEGSNNHLGCCHGSCTHVWNYEQATAFLFGDLAWTMRDVEFAQATDDRGLMSFRVNLPLTRKPFGKAAADGQMGTLMKLYREWQLSGRDAELRRLWPMAKKALEFCWIPGGWDADRDGVMEGCQHNTMDVEYYGPNPQMGIWYLGALRAAEEMARHIRDAPFANTCRTMFESGRAWVDRNLFNGEYYQHEVRAPRQAADVAPELLVGMGAADPTKPEFQLAEGCLVDQLVGQYMAHVCGLGYLVDAGHVRTTLRSILKYNLRPDLHGHFNNMRAFALDGESALLMAGYPKSRPENPFPYFAEVMTGFEYTAAAGLLYEGLVDEGLDVIARVRARYDGLRRNPFDEAECGHHYARAMASWAAILALTGFGYSAVTKTLTLGTRPGRFPWSTGHAWGEYVLDASSTGAAHLELTALEGTMTLTVVRLRDHGEARFDSPRTTASTKPLQVSIARRDR